MKKCLAVLFFLFIIAGCNSNNVFEEVYDFESSGWHLDSIPEFTFENSDNLGKNISIQIRNKIDYEYQNLYLAFELTDSASDVIEEGLINLQLFDEKTGKPNGKGSSIFAHDRIILGNYNFPYQGSFTLKVAQYMREVELKEVLSLGISISKVD